MKPILYSVTRAERVRMVADLRAQGFTYKQVSEKLGISPAYVRDLVNDPTGEKLAQRRRTNSGVCVDCGGPTNGNGGRANAPKRCDSCSRERVRADHGTRSRYLSGCSCDACRAANRDYMRSLKGKPPPNHNNSGYSNYGCRCQICKDAHLVYERSKGYEYQHRYRQKKRRERGAA